MKLVLDTDVIVAAVQSERGASRELLLRIVVGELAAGVSVPLLLDYEAVLKRPAQLAASGLSTADIDVILDEIAAVMEHVRLFFLWRPALRDAGDDMVLETAVNGGADCIVTFNDADFGAAPSRFGIVGGLHRGRGGRDPGARSPRRAGCVPALEVSAAPRSRISGIAGA